MMQVRHSHHSLTGATILKVTMHIWHTPHRSDKDLEAAVTYMHHIPPFTVLAVLDLYQVVAGHETGPRASCS